MGGLPWLLDLVRDVHSWRLEDILRSTEYIIIRRTLGTGARSSGCTRTNPTLKHHTTKP